MCKRSPSPGLRLRVGAAGVACALLWAMPARAEVDEPVVRVSDVTETVAAQWLGYGFRMQLRMGYQDWQGIAGVPSGDGINFNLEPGWRLRPAWSLGLDLDYTVLLAGMTGLRLSVGLGPTWHPTDGLQLGAIVGYAAMLGSWAHPNSLGSTVVDKCDGQGVLGKVRLAYMFQVSEVWSTGPAVAAGLSWMQCREVSSTSIDADPYNAPFLSPWWQYNVNAMWAVTWR